MVTKQPISAAKPSTPATLGNIPTDNLTEPDGLYERYTIPAGEPTAATCKMKQDCQSNLRATPYQGSSTAERDGEYGRLLEGNHLRNQFASLLESSFTTFLEWVPLKEDELKPPPLGPKPCPLGPKPHPLGQKPSLSGQNSPSFGPKPSTKQKPPIKLPKPMKTPKPPPRTKYNILHKTN